ncbi:MAG: hypothetical protein J6581_10055, partial [Apibacter sp.]|nr:hypothetical protein [Apibacter sp.]
LYAHRDARRYSKTLRNFSLFLYYTKYLETSLTARRATIIRDYEISKISNFSAKPYPEVT